MATFTITYDYGWEAVLEINLSSETMEKMKEQLLFWSGGQQRIDRVEGDVTKAFLIMLGDELIRRSIYQSREIIIDEFNSLEGWYPLDGSCGIELLQISTWEFLTEDIEIKQHF